MKTSEILLNMSIDVNHGICNNYDIFIYSHLISRVFLRDSMEKYDISFNEWPHYSGDPRFPINTDKTVSAREQYIFIDNKWNKQNEYGRQRHDLLAWLIKQFEAKGA